MQLVMPVKDRDNSFRGCLRATQLICSGCSGGAECVPAVSCGSLIHVERWSLWGQKDFGSHTMQLSPPVQYVYCSLWNKKLIKQNAYCKQIQPRIYSNMHSADVTCRYLCCLELESVCSLLTYLWGNTAQTNLEPNDTNRGFMSILLHH